MWVDSYNPETPIETKCSKAGIGFDGTETGIPLINSYKVLSFDSHRKDETAQNTWCLNNKYLGSFGSLWPDNKQENGD